MSGTERPGGSQQGLDRFVSKNDQRGIALRPAGRVS
jgi:hypothetical protein